MSRHGKPGPEDEDWQPFHARGKPVALPRHALDGMTGERRPISPLDVVKVLEEPDHDNGKEASRWLRGRTIKVYYTEAESRIIVLGVSATRRRFRG